MTTETQTQLSLKQLTELVLKLQAELNEIKTKTVRNEAEREMTKDDALRIMNGDLKDLKHKDAATKLGLSYGQVYSCRLGYTFKEVHKQLKAENFTNPWIK